MACRPAWSRLAVNVIDPMGLEMFLDSHTYIGNLKRKPHEQVKLIIPGFPHIRPERVEYVSERVGYWRNADAIHSWFVENVMDGIEEKGGCYVSTEDLKKLCDLVDRVLADRTLAKDLLPTPDGLCFGPTEYGANYFGYLEDTRKLLSGVLKENRGNYDYSSFW